MKFFATGFVAAILAIAFFAAQGGSTVSATPPPDACGNPVINAPDRGLTFDFTSACQAHDDCYSYGGYEADRRNCDNAFVANMINSCYDMWPYQIALRHRCLEVAGTYYQAVRVGGWLFFTYGYGNRVPTLHYRLSRLADLG